VRAQILIVNHHLLFADLAIRQQTGSFEDAAILPPYECIIFDEAHHLENVATSYFGSRITRAGIIRILRRLHRQKRAIAKGYLLNVSNKLQSSDNIIPGDIQQKLLDKIFNAIIPNIENLSDMTDELMDFLYEVLQRVDNNEESREKKVRLLPPVVDKVFNQTVLGEQFRDYIQAMKTLATDLNSLVSQIKKLVQESEEDTWDSLFINIEASAERVAAVADILHEVIFKQDEENIRWIEAKPGYKNQNLLHFQVSPLHVKDMMKKAVLDVFDTIVMTSATLTTENSFDFISGRLGLTELSNDKKIFLQLQSPFDYAKQVVIAIPTDIPDPRHPAFASELADAIYRALIISRGRAFVLFTSYGLLQMIYRQLEGQLGAAGIRCLKQGTLNRHDLLNLFKQDTGSVLFATDSFWEGVDVEGEALESVIITKLPFRVPSEPVIEARYEAIEKNGGNAFLEYAVPMAVLKFKQGFGRLIRRKTDRGCVIIFDNRVVSKNYGKRFLGSLPECHQVIAPRQQVYSELDKFFTG